MKTRMKAGKLWLLLILCCSVMMTMLPAAYAATTVNITSDDVKTYTSFSQAADAIDQFVDTAFEFWLEGDTRSAYNHVNNAYFVVYEVTGFERQTMSYVSGSRKNAVELEFSTCKAAVKKELTEDNKAVVRTELMKLKKMIREDANKLDARKDLPSSVMTFWENGVQIDYDPYGELVGDMDAAPKYKNWAEAASATNNLLSTSQEGYEARERDVAYDNFNTAYYTVYEESGLSHAIFNYLGLEEREKIEESFSTAKDIVYAFHDGGSLQKTKAGNAFRKLRSALAATAASIDEKVAEQEAEQAAATAAETAETESTETASSDSSSGAWLVFGGAFGIIVREGLEAILVIAAIIAYLVKSGNGKSLKSVYIGSVLGIIASFVAAWLLTVLKARVGEAYGSQSQEVIEGITALIAVCVLFYVSNWMISKSEAASWTRYIDNKVQGSVEKGSAFTLAFTAFLSVFREGAEVVLFYQPMLTEDGNPGMVWAGFGVGCVVLVGVYLAIRYLSIKLPIKPFFTATSILMAFMCVSFLGSGIKELAEGGVLDVTNIPWMPAENDVLDVLGIYPCVETIFPQLIMLGVLACTFVAAKYRGKIDRIEAEHAAEKAVK